MAKTKTVFFCKECGNEYARWQGKCDGCGAWNSLVEEKFTKSKADNSSPKVQAATPKPVRISEIDTETQPRLALQDDELNRVLGGGMVPGSLVLLAGEPGIGKSTLLLQAAMRHKGGKILYVSGEESSEQITQRAQRLGALNSDCYLMTVTNPEQIMEEAKELQPEFVVIDSVQTLDAEWLDSAPGSISQIRESAASLMRFAKSAGITVFLIGHITKEGSIAGPKILEHMVDTVLVFEGDQQQLFRLLRGTKNRFGSTHELGIYRMEESGLYGVENPSELLFNNRTEDLSGSAAAAILEGMRPLIIEVQALVSTAVYGTPQRSSTGFDVRRLHMLLAVLEKRCGFRLGAKDVFLNIAGGLKINDPSIDLAVAAAILSSSEDLTIPSDTCFAAEIGLAGEIRPIAHIEQRISEAGKLGFKRIFVSTQQRLNQTPKGIEVIAVGKIQDMLRNMFG